MTNDKKSSLRQRLAEKREDMGITQRQIGDIFNIEQATVSSYEVNSRKLKKAGLDFSNKFFRAYGFSESEAVELTRELFDEELKQFIPEIPPNASLATADGPTAMHYGPVSAGIKGHSKQLKPYPTLIPGWLARKYDSADIFVVTVEGDSMTCDDIRKSIPEGTEVYFHKKLTPHVGEVVAVWLEDRDFGVIKIYKPERETSVLQSYNFKHPPILIDESNPAIIQGVYVGKSEPSWIRFDR